MERIFDKTRMTDNTKTGRHLNAVPEKFLANLPIFICGMVVAVFMALGFTG